MHLLVHDPPDKCVPIVESRSNWDFVALVGRRLQKLDQAGKLVVVVRSSHGSYRITDGVVQTIGLQNPGDREPDKQMEHCIRCGGEMRGVCKRRCVQCGFELGCGET